MPRHPVPQAFGDVQVITPANPAAGANLIYTLPAGYRYQIMAVRMIYASDANVANRNLILQITDAVPNTLWEVMNLLNHAASTTTNYTFSDHGYSHTAFLASRMIAAIPVRMTLRAGWIIRTLINNVQVGDQLSGIAITLHQWEESAP